MAFKPGHIYLHNNYNTDMVFDLAMDVSVAAPTLRKTARIPRSICVKRGEIYDLNTRQGLTRLQALDVLSRTTALARMPNILVIDTDNRPVEPILPATPVVAPSIPSAAALEQIAKDISLEFEAPSISWSRVKLAEHAETRGIEVVSTMTKAAILRKIRATK